MAVSKFCCPACWELLAILRQLKGGGLDTRGRHSTVYPVELPPWLPHDVLDALLWRFRELTRTELEKMVQKFNSRGTHHARSPSEESSSAASTSSNSATNIFYVKRGQQTYFDSSALPTPPIEPARLPKSKIKGMLGYFRKRF